MEPPPRVEEHLLVRRLEQVPSAEDFSRHIEPGNVPAVFPGAVKDWKAFTTWNPLHAGLHYLKDKVGSAIVEAMRSSSAPVFYGDLRGHERVPLPFSAFINCCESYLQNMSNASSSLAVHEDSVIGPSSTEEACSTSLGTPDQYYLAQVPIMNTENKEGCPLEVLQEDFQKPTFLARTNLASVNLWMNRSRSRSSTHYDPHHNLLCVVSGRKEVVLWPPSACRVLYPLPIYGEASNHSAVDLEKPDFSLHSRAKYSKEYSQTIILHPGDALFIPEGWFHQVDSEDLTIAVNFWWKSNQMSNMLEHMDAYYIRRMLNRLVVNEMSSNCAASWKTEGRERSGWVAVQAHMLRRTSVGSLKDGENCQPPIELVKARENHESIEGCQKFDSTEHKGTSIERPGSNLSQLEPPALCTLHKLISVVHDSVKISGQGVAVESTCTKDVVDPRNEHKVSTLDNSLLDQDPIASILSSVESSVLQKVLLAMVHQFPRTLEALILHVLSPAAAELLTRKFDEMDQQTTKEEQNEFYQQFYSVFDDQYAAMNALLNGKESFAFQAFQRVLHQYVGVSVEKP